MAGPEQTPNREEKALQALISAALHVNNDNVTLEEIQPYLNSDVTLSAEDEAALRLSKKRLVREATPQTQGMFSEAESFMALHRKRPTSGFSAKTEDEIKRKREELLQKLRKKKGGN